MMCPSQPNTPLQKPVPAGSWASSCLLSTAISSPPMEFHLIYFLNPDSVEQKLFVTIILPKAKQFYNKHSSVPLYFSSLQQCFSSSSMISPFSSFAILNPAFSLCFHSRPCDSSWHLQHISSFIHCHLPKCYLHLLILLFSSSIPPLSALCSPTYVSNNSIFPMSESYTPLLTFRILLVL